MACCGPLLIFRPIGDRWLSWSQLEVGQQPSQCFLQWPRRATSLEWATEADICSHLCQLSRRHVVGQAVIFWYRFFAGIEEYCTCARQNSLDWIGLVNQWPCLRTVVLLTVRTDLRWPSDKRRE